MLRKLGKYFANWRDEHGVRHRKAFASADTARRHQRSMQRQVATKKSQASGASANSVRPGRKAATLKRSRRSRSSSRRISALSRPTKSRRRKSRQSSTAGGTTARPRSQPTATA